MLIHELSIAIQQDRERAVHRALTARRHLSGASTRSGIQARVRALLGRPEPPRHPRAPIVQPDLRPSR